MNPHSKPAKVRLKGFLVKKLLSFCARQSLSALYNMGGWLGRLLYRLGGRAVDVTRINIRFCFPHLEDQEKERLIKRSLQETMRCGLEFGWCWQADMETILDSIQAVHGLEHLKDAHQQGKGVIVLGPHLGNWELFGHYVNQYYPFSVMYAEPKLAELSAVMVEGRCRAGMKLAPANLKGVAQQLKWLQKGEAIGILPDQEPDDRSGGVFAPFMGIEALSPKLVTRLIAKTGAQVVAGFAQRLPEGQGFDIHIIPADVAIYSADETEAATGMNRMVEQLVAIAPEQYQWEYKRFQTRPNEGQDPYP